MNFTEQELDRFTQNGKEEQEMRLDKANERIRNRKNRKKVQIISEESQTITAGTPAKETTMENKDTTTWKEIVEIDKSLTELAAKREAEGKTPNECRAELLSAIRSNKTTLTEMEKSICKNMEITEEQYLGANS